MQHNFKCSACFGETNDFDIGTPDAPFFPGTTPTLTVDVTDVDGVTPVVLTGAVIYLTCKKDPGDADPGLFQLSTTSGEIVLSPQSGSTVGQFVVTFPSDATANLSAMLDYLYDVRIILAGDIQNVLFGTLRLTPTITQAVS